MAAVGARAMRHPRAGNQADPICMMLLLDALMKIDVHSLVRSRELAPLMDGMYNDYIWDARQVGKLLHTLYECQDKSSSPSWGVSRALTRHRPHGTWEYTLYPARETYIWLAKMRKRMQEFNGAVIRKERRTKVRAAYSYQFPVKTLWDKEFLGDTRSIRITDGIVFRQL